MKNTTVRKIQTTKVLGPKGEVIPATLDDLVKQIRTIVSDKNFIKNSRTYNNAKGGVEALLISAYRVTTYLVNLGAEKGGLDSDKYNILTAKTSSFGNKSALVNELILSIQKEAADGMKDLENLPELKDTKITEEGEEEPLEADQKAKLLAEPVTEKEVQESRDPEQDNSELPDPFEQAYADNVVEIIVKDGGRLIVDKTNGEAEIFLLDGTSKVFKIVQEKNWRTTALNWLRRAFRAVKKAAVKVAKVLNPFNWFKKKEEKPTSIPVQYPQNGEPFYYIEDVPEGVEPPKGMLRRSKKDK